MKGKILYNRFIRAISKVIFVFLAMIVLAIAIIGNELYTSDIIDDSGDFYASQILEDTVCNYSSRVSHYLYYEAENYYLNNDEDSSSKGSNDIEEKNSTEGNPSEDEKPTEKSGNDDNYESKETETTSVNSLEQNNDDEDNYGEYNDDEYNDDEDNYGEDSDDENDYENDYEEDNDDDHRYIEIYYTGTNQYEILRYGIKSDIVEVLKSSEMKEKLEHRMDILCKNYGFRIRYNDEVIFTTIDNESEYVFINTADNAFINQPYDAYYDHIFIDNYVRKNIVKGDEFYICEKWYNFFNNNITTIIIICGFVVLLTIILAIYIILTTGYNEKGELEVSWLDNIPIELYILLTVIVCFIVSEMLIGVNAISEIVILAIGLMIIMGLLVIDMETSISRLKNKVFLRKSFFGKILLLCIKIIKDAFINIDRKWKACLCISLVFLWETIIVIVVASTLYESGGGMLIWIFIKIAEFILLMYFYNNISDIRDGVRDMYNGVTDVKIDTRKMSGMFRKTAEYINEVSVGLDKAVSEKLKSEQLKTELITNVSHDIKTPLTSIINYIDLMKKENIDNETLKEYLNVVDKQSMRLKKLTEDVIEASKAATGNISVEMTDLNISEMLSQSLGEYESKFSQRNLQIIYNDTETPKYVLADGKLLWRVFDNLFSNIYKYSLEGTRVYIDISESEEDIKIIMKNVSENQLNISSDELMQRFVRGDVSRNTSGNGLGLSIAESLAKLQNGRLDININGDLFISVLSLKKQEVRHKND